MLFILIIILIIIGIILSMSKNKNIVTPKLSGKKIISILLIFILLFGCLKLLFKIHDIIFFFQSLKYNYIDNYDYSNDIVNNGYISKDGAIKIAKEKTNKKRIAKVTCKLIEENGTYNNNNNNEIHQNNELYNEMINKSSDILNNNNQETFWSISLKTGWDYSCGHEEIWYFKIDYYTGKILHWDVTM